MRSRSPALLAVRCSAVCVCESWLFTLGARVDCFQFVALDYCCWEHLCASLLILVVLLFVRVCVSERNWRLLGHLDVQLERVSNCCPKSFLPVLWVPVTLSWPPLSTACFFFVLVIPTGRCWCLVVVLVWISLITTEVEQLLVSVGHLTKSWCFSVTFVWGRHFLIDLLKFFLYKCSKYRPFVVSIFSSEWLALLW